MAAAGGHWKAGSFVASAGAREQQAHAFLGAIGITVDRLGYMDRPLTGSQKTAIRRLAREKGVPLTVRQGQNYQEFRWGNTSTGSPLVAIKRILRGAE